MNKQDGTAVAMEPSFSRHALARMTRRGIDLSVGQRGRLGEAMACLAAKGARHALVLLDQIALVVSIEQCRVVTVVGQQGLREHIFTNVDSAMLA